MWGLFLKSDYIGPHSALLKLNILPSAFKCDLPILYLHSKVALVK